jgi:peptide/nickel transport system permease protein
MSVPGVEHEMPGTGHRSRLRPLGTFCHAVLSNRKATAGAVLLAVCVFMAVAPGLIAPGDPQAQIYMPGQGPSRDNLLGTTSYGQDIFTQFVWGAQASLVIAVVAGLLSTVLSALIGVTAGYFGGIIDGFLSLVTDIFLVIPAFPLVVVIAAYSKNGGNAVIVAVLVATGWSYGARQLRAQVLALRHREFLVAARLRGERGWRIVVSEILPNMVSLLVANFLGASVYAILTAAGLQFIGLGSVNTDSWGTMLYWAQNNEALQAGIPLWAIAPGVGIAVLGAAFALLNYAFDEISNPVLRPMRRKRARRSA